MTIKIPADVESRLVVRLAEGIQATKSEYDFIATTDFKWADALTAELSEDAQSKLVRSIGDNYLSRFVAAEVSLCVASATPYIKPKAGKLLTQVPALSNPIAVARSLVESLKLIPKRYQVTAALPKQFSDPIGGEIPERTDLPSGITLLLGSALPTDYPTTSNNAVINTALFADVFGGSEEKHSVRDIYANRLYFSMPLLGYATDSHSSVLGRDFEDNLRSFYGACLALNVIDFGWKTRGEKLPYIMIHSDDFSTILGTERLEDDLIDREFRFSTEGFFDKNKEDVWSAFSSTMARIGTIFIDDVDCRRLFTACIWYYRAKLNRRPLDALLEATISIEVMLGDRKAAEGVGLANLLGSRCAFLLGRSSKQRERIALIFKEIYGLRSSIVHDGRHSPRPDDRKVINSALSMCASIIGKELEIRAKDS